jgi:hypothetical protein
MAIDNPNWNYRLIDTNTSSVTLTNSTSWTNLFTSNSFNHAVSGPIHLDLNLIHQWEEGATNVQYRFLMLYSNGNTASTQTNGMQVAKQGQGAHMAFGSHNMHWTFYNMPAHNGYQVRVQGRNIGGSSTHITTYFSPNIQIEDILVITYQA